MHSISTYSVSAPPNPENLRRARLRARGVSDAAAGILSVLAFGEPRDGWVWPVPTSSMEVAHGR